MPHSIPAATETGDQKTGGGFLRSGVGERQHERRSPRTRPVSSVQAQSTPPTPPSSSGMGLYDQVKYVSSRNWFRSMTSIPMLGAGQ